MLTEAQSNALQLARRDAIRYYKGGWYSIPSIMGDDQRNPRVNMDKEAFTTPQTLKSLVKMGSLKTNSTPDIYAQRWSINEETK